MTPSGDDGILFGESCERRVFFPGSSKQVAASIDANDALHITSKDPLRALGLLSPSPYVVLKRSAPVSAAQGGDTVKRSRTPNQPHRFPKQGSADTVRVIRSTSPQQPSRTTQRCGESPPHDCGALEAIYGGKHSPQRIQRHGVFRDRRRGTNETGNPPFDSFRQDQSVAMIYHKTWPDEAATRREATRLRREADPSILIKRFLRSFGFPLGHVFATAARVYRRSHLRPAFSNWHASVVEESRQYNRRMKAATIIKTLIRIHLARRVADRYHHKHGPGVIKTCSTIQRKFLGYRARQSVQERLALKRRNDKLQKKKRDVETATTTSCREAACTVIQAVWRGAMGCREGGARARRKLQDVLVDLGGGQGRMHRVHDCIVPAGCLEHVILARAYKIGLRAPVLSRGQTHEAIALLLRCRAVLAARRHLRNEMGCRWAEEMGAHMALKAQLDRAQKVEALRQGVWKREKLEEEEKQARERKQKELTQRTNARLKELHARQRIHVDRMEGERRRRCESYLMWREEFRQRGVAEESKAMREKRESRELVIMRKEELLAKQAWALEAARFKYAVELWDHEERVSRLFRTSSPPSNDAAAVRATLIDLDDARKRVAHWGARCRVDAECAARIRGEQFRMRCKTKWDRRRKAADVAAAKTVAEISIKQLTAALNNARHATVARAMALSEALGEHPPRMLLACKVADEHRKRLLVRDVTAGECTYSIVPLTAKAGDKGGGSATGVSIAKCNEKDKEEIGTTATRSNTFSPHKGVNSLAHCNKPGNIKCPDRLLSVDAVKLDTSHQRSRAAAGLQGADTKGFSFVDLGWNKEWCRLIDDWCQRVSARFRLRFTKENVSSARRIHWLAGSLSDRGGTQPDPRKYDVHGGVKALGKNKATTEVIGREGWAALAKFGKVADLLELMGSTAEVVVSVESLEEKDSTTSKGCAENIEGFENGVASHIQLAKDINISSLKGPRVGTSKSANITLGHPKGVKGEEEDSVEAPVVDDTDANVWTLNAICNSRGVPDENGRASTATSAHESDKEEPKQPKRLSNGAVIASGSPDPLLPRGSLSPVVLMPVDPRARNEMESEDRKEEVRLLKEKGTSTHEKIKFRRRHTNRTAGGDSGKRGGGDPLITRNFEGCVGHIVLGPATLRAALGISPVSAFVLEVGRRTHACSTSPEGVAASRDMGSSTDTGRPPVATVGSCSSTGMNSPKAAKRPLQNRMTATRQKCLREGFSNGPEKSIVPPVLLCHAFARPVALSGAETARILSETEKNGLACAIETLLFPSLRISFSTRDTTKGITLVKGVTDRLSLNFELPIGGMRFQEGKGGAVQGAVNGGNAEFDSEEDVNGDGTEAGETTESMMNKRNCTIRFLQAPVTLWVGEVGGHRCLLSCPAARMRKSVSSLEGSGGPSRARETHILNLPSENLQKSAQKGSLKGGTGTRDVFPDTSCLCATFVCSSIGNTLANHSGLPSSDRQYHQQTYSVMVGVAPSAVTSVLSGDFWRGASVGFALDRPLCTNCGRRALRQVLYVTDLLSQRPPALPEVVLSLLGFRREEPSTVNDRLLIGRQDTHNRKHVVSTGGVDRNMLLVSMSHRRLLFDCGRRYGALSEGIVGGRLADWVCQSGTVLCNPCLKALQPLEVPLKRVPFRDS